jgi:hypothetical protein
MSFVAVYAKNTYIKLNVYVKGKNHPMTCLCRHRGEAELYLQPICNLCAKTGWVVSTTPWPLYHQEDLVPIVQEAGWALGLVLMGKKNLAPLGFDPQTVQPIVICYIDYAIPATLKIYRCN